MKAVTLLALILAFGVIGIAQSSTSPKESSAQTGEVTLGEVDKLLEENAGTIILASLNEADREVSSAKAVKVRNLKLPQPEYPARAKAVRAQGEVAVKVLIDEKGKVMGAQVVSGHPLLKAATLKAAREAEFPPTLLDGQPVKVVGVIMYNFTLQ